MTFSSTIFARAAVATLLLGPGVLAAVDGCGGTVSHTTDLGFPEKSRPLASACPEPRPPAMPVASDAGPVFPGACRSDAECTQGLNGRCMQVGNRAGPTCTYDACVLDGDCGGVKVCECEGQGNRCVDANCHTDADCDGRGCSPTFDLSCGPYDGVQGYYCHTATDECVRDSDCSHDSGSGYCAFSPQVGHWVCGKAFCAG